MKETFVNNIDELMTANQNQRIKINYLESQKQKRQEYLSGLKESIMLNKQTLIVLNEEGPNNPALASASKENQQLIKLNQTLYTQNRQLNAYLLMEQQLRIQDRSFYTERIAQFQNRITDLRKYLHDKEESFSAVAARLKKYEEWNQKPLAEKIQDTEGLKRVTTEIIAQLMAEKNMFKAKFEEVFPDAQRVKVLSQALKNPTNLSRLIQEINHFSQQQNTFSQSGSPRQKLVDFYVGQHKNSPQQERKPSNGQLKQTQMTRQLMRLLKKQKINNQILETALHSAIQKNEELLKINENLDLALHSLEKKMEKLISQNHFYKLRIKDFSFGYGRKYAISNIKQAYDQPSFQQLLKLNFQIKDEQNQRVSTKVYKDLLKESLREDIKKFFKIPVSSIPKFTQIKGDCKVSQQERITEMTTNDNTLLNEKMGKSKNDEKPSKIKQRQQNIGFDINIHRKMMIRSSSQPRIFIRWQDEAFEQEQEHNQHEEMVIEEF